LKTRKGRSHGRPIATKSSMHVVLRSSKAKGSLSFRTPRNQKAISKIVGKFSQKFGVQVHSLANVGNHLHFHIKVSKRKAYISFIRAVTSSIRVAIAGHPRWEESFVEGKFWDYRPFSRVVRGRQGFLNLEDYIAINMIEGLGVPKSQARWILGYVQQRRRALRNQHPEGVGEAPLIC